MTEFVVPFIDLQDRWQEEREDILAIVDRIGTAGNFVLTDEVGAFETKVQLFTGARHCVSLNSGTDALFLALRAAGIGAGDEVITAPNSFVASAGAIAQAGARPAFADVRDDQNMDPADLERRITPATRAVLPVHWSGRIADMDAICEVAERHGLVVIEDAAQTMGAYYHDRHGGRFGKAAAFSAHPLKNLNAIGDGGFLITDDDAIAERVRLIRNHGLQDRDTCLEFGVNSRLDTLNAEVLSYRLDRLEGVVAARRKNVAQYRELIRPGPVFIPEEKPHEKGSYVLFIVQADDRDGLRDHLQRQGIQALIYYGVPLHLQPVGRALGYGPGDFPNAERQAERVLALPHHQYLSEDQISFVAEQVNAYYA